MNTNNPHDIHNRLVALDLECSSSEWDGVITSIGMVHLATEEEYYAEMKYKDPITVDAEALRHNDVTIESIDQHEDGRRRPISEVDNEARAWLKDVTGVTKQWKLTAVGFGVGRFDLPYMLHCAEPMERTRNMFSWVPIDLSDACKLLDVAAGEGFKSTKRRVKAHVDEEHTHNALDDARQAAEVLLTLRDHVNVEEFWLQ